MRDKIQNILIIIAVICVAALCRDSCVRTKAHLVRWQADQTNTVYIPETNYLGRLTGHEVLELGFMDDGRVVYRPVKSSK